MSPTDTMPIPLNPPIQYSLIWLLVACCLALLIVFWYAFVFWHTRRRKLQTLETLKPLTEEERLLALKQQYLRYIDQGYVRYQNGETTLRALHHGLSMAVRYFVYEAAHFPAPRLTLSDLEHAPYPKLTLVIADYYRKEFATIENGDPTSAVLAAKELITQWT